MYLNCFIVFHFLYSFLVPGENIHVYVIKLTAQTFYPLMGVDQDTVHVTPKLFVELAMNPRIGEKTFVPDNCYGTQTENRFDPYRVYFIGSR